MIDGLPKPDKIGKDAEGHVSLIWYSKTTKGHGARLRHPQGSRSRTDRGWILNEFEPRQGKVQSTFFAVGSREFIIRTLKRWTEKHIP